MTDQKCTGAEDIADNLASECGWVVLFELFGVSASLCSYCTNDEELTAKVHD